MRFVRTEWWLAAVLGVLTWAVYDPVRHADFVNFDDPVYVADNPQVRSGLSVAAVRWAFTHFHAGYWLPATWVSFQLDSQLQGPGPAGYHQTNLVLHIANALLLFGLLRYLTGAIWPSFLTAALFALHPMHVESVAWVTERKDVLSTFFGLLALAAFSAYARRPRVGWYLLACLLLALSLMAKPMLVTFPALLLLLDYWPLGRWNRASRIRLLLEKVPFLALAMVAGVLTVLAQKEIGALSLLEELPLRTRVGNALVAYLLYLGKTFWPVDLAVYYPPESGGYPRGQVIVAGLLLLLTSAVSIWKARRWPWLAVGWFWFVGTMLPVSGLMQAGDQALADRFSYFPHIGLFVAVSWALASVPYRRTAGLAAGVAVAGCVWLSLIQVGYWQNSIVLWQHCLDVTGPNALADYNLGWELLRQKKPEEALPYFLATVQSNPEAWEASYFVGMILLHRGNPAEAVPYLQAAQKLQPQYEPVRHELARAYYLVGRVHVRDKQWASAADSFSRGLQLQSGNLALRINVAWALHHAGRADDARREYDAATRINPHWAESALRQAWVLATHPDAKYRHGPLAVELAEQVCQSQDKPPARAFDTLAAAFADVGNFGQAVAAGQKALEAARNEGNMELAQVIQTRLARYQSGKPFRAMPTGK